MSSRLGLRPSSADEQVHLVWRGWLLVDSSVIQRTEAGKILQGIMAANKATWPVGLEAGWHQPLVSYGAWHNCNIC